LSNKNLPQFVEFIDPGKALTGGELGVFKPRRAVRKYQDRTANKTLENKLLNY